MYSIGYDIGTSFIKACLFEIQTGEKVHEVTYPESEQAILSESAGWAEQHPEMWWKNTEEATKILLENFDGKEVKYIGISYQMHGLVLVNESLQVIRPSIIWCDSRAVETGNTAFKEIGASTCLDHLLNSPGNFTASKLKWVKENEPENYSKIFKLMLPGDFIAMKLSGKCTTTISGLSEGMFWDYKTNSLSQHIFDYYDLDERMIPEIVSNCGSRVIIESGVAKELGISENTTITYRAGDQPNNAFSLNVNQPGEVAATAGTSGVVYAVTNKTVADKQSRVNGFAHINYTVENPVIGNLLCVNGTGIAYAWLKRFLGDSYTYYQLNELAAQSVSGANGLSFLPFGNGAERMLENRILNAQFSDIDFNQHELKDIVRSVVDGIAFAKCYGIEILKNISGDLNTIRVGNSNLFLNTEFAQTIANVSGCKIEYYNTDGAEGAARGAVLGGGEKSSREIFSTLKKIKVVVPSMNMEYKRAFEQWKQHLKNRISKNEIKQEIQFN